MKPRPPSIEWLCDCGRSGAHRHDRMWVVPAALIAAALALMVLLMGCEDPKPTPAPTSGPSPVSACKELRRTAHEEVHACEVMCPGRGDYCPRTSCTLNNLRAWLERQPACRRYIGSYNPDWPKVSLVVDDSEAKDEDF